MWLYEHLPGNLQLPAFQDRHIGRCRGYGLGRFPLALAFSALGVDGSAVTGRVLGSKVATAQSAVAWSISWQGQHGTSTLSLWLAVV